MDFLTLFQLFLVLIVPGLIAAIIYQLVSRRNIPSVFVVGLSLDLLTFIIMITGLYFLKGVTTIAALIEEFGCLSFTRRYALLSLLIAIILGIIFGLIRRLIPNSTTE